MQDGKEQVGRNVPRVVKAARYSYQGLVYSFKNEASFREEAIAAALLVPLALWLDITAVERALLIAAVLIVLIVELINTSIEAVVDRVGLERHALAGAAKDAGSAAVLVTLLLWALVWGSILWARYL